jgi:Pentapeptide repeats (8 copies)
VDWTQVWNTYAANREHIVPLLTLVSGLLTIIVGSIVAYAALKQARIARDRHEEQIKADLQRRITEGFTTAVEQLGSDKLQVRLGGIYALERISRESPSDYWMIIETLTGFVRERVPWTDENTEAREPKGFEEEGMRPPTDVAAALTVIGRRDEQSRSQEQLRDRQLFLPSTDLRGVNLYEAHLEGAWLAAAHLEGAYLYRAYLDGAWLTAAHLEGANVNNAHLKGAHLEAAYLEGAHLEGADLSDATGLKEEQLANTIGDGKTKLPQGVKRPAHWPPFEPRAELPKSP